jgi:tight adherence protein B
VSRSRPGTRAAPALGFVASTVQRLAVLLAAGVAPASAWQHVQANGSALAGSESAMATSGSAMATSVAAEAARGAPIADAILANLSAVPSTERDAWRGLAAAWRVATDAGAPLAPSLRGFAGSLRSLADAQREISVALAAPIATARLVMVLPGVGILFGLVLGFDSLSVLFTTPPGLVCLVAGCALMLVAWAWNRRLVAAARPTSLTPGLRFELMAIAVSGGAAFDRASSSVQGALESAGVPATHDVVGVEGLLALSRSAGVPAAELLRSEGEEARRAARADAAAKASVLAVRLMLPLGLCVLPAFMLLGVAPLLLAVITSTVSGL